MATGANGLRLLRRRHKFMKLRECKMGILVKVKEGEIGHIVGLTYNVHVRHTGNLCVNELIERTIALVRLPDGTDRGIHPSNLDEL